ncbi:DUF4181 domain-containing protein [Virgibacillus necropolis]|uniref:DUF4181 domain-containing protein n=1 Tax=Virgibacillus necropolis TaxID=163877 RepID=UPI00385148E2
MKFVAFFIGLLILLFVVEKVTNKILGVERKKVSETSGKNLDFWGRGIILVIFLSTLWFVITNNSDILTKFYWMTYLALLIGFQVIMEFIFIKESKQYISTTLLLILCLVVMYNIDNFPFLDLIL